MTSEGKFEAPAALYEAGTVGSIVLPALARFRQRPALRDDSRSWSYEELGLAMRRATGGLRNAGLVAGQGFAILAPSRVETVAVMLAGLLLGLRYTPLHPMASVADQRVVIEDAEVSLLIVDVEAFGNRIADLVEASEQPVLTRSIEASSDYPSIFAQETALRNCVAPEALAYLTYTGGTTGRPKGVMLSHRAVAAMSLALAADWDWPSPLTLLLTTPISHAAGALIYPALSRGGAIRLTRGFTPDGFAALVAEEGITATMLVPTMLYRLLEGDDPLLARCQSLKMIAYGAAPMAPDQLASALGILGPVFLQFYGQTEAPQIITTLRCADHDHGDAARLRSCGLPSPVVDVRLVDAHGSDVDDGQPGELVVRGPIVMSGYWKQPQLSAELLVGGWLKTGDVGRRDADGFLSIVGRTKDLIITGGFNVYPSEVERALMNHLAVAQAVVVGIPDAKWGEAVGAIVVLRDGASVTSDDLREWVRSMKGPVYAPKTVKIDAAIPLTNLGKPDRKQIVNLLVDKTL